MLAVVSVYVCLPFQHERWVHVSMRVSVRER